MSDPIPVADAEHARALYEPLTQSVRRLVDLTIRSEADDDAVRRAHRLVDEAAALLGSRAAPGSFGIRTDAAGRPMPWGNVAIGVRNAIAPPLDVHRDADGRATADLVLGAPYEGPPGQVHGGVCALVLDHVLGATAHHRHQTAFTGTLTIRYVRPTWLGPLRAEAWVDREEGSKTFAVGHLLGPDGEVTAHAEGVFIRPRSAR
ncbi:PaaI family thioesterase [Mycolicibacterium smegmatis]|uniref:Acyl-coenzyme A thioesterase THEM4 n=1 Tax=Mycolicibacterium smegmatis (strain MKD8) TaxID=1214915 RepID=A0A2U9PPU3_MYCSE|nr:PaaI family thioesterase [Mycolicibacterium smegmatis]AWT53789.1 thioesterase family protein [Mycolicibacterium smegmatis MKD8]